MSRTAANLSPEELREYGLLPAVPRDLDGWLAECKPERDLPLLDADMEIPDTELASAVAEFAKETLPAPTFNHSQRVYEFGSMIRRQHLQGLTFSSEAFYILCLLHDLGTAPGYLETTVLSFEFAGGIAARSLLKNLGAPQALADSVCEAIIRHQDCGNDGMLSALGGLIQVATLFDNTGKFSELLHRGSVDDVVAQWPRLGWSGCFSNTIAEEGERKPWCHTSVIGVENFKQMILGNKVGNKYEQKAAEQLL